MKLRLHLNGQNHFGEDEWTSIHAAFKFFIDEFKLDQYDARVYVQFPRECKSLLKETNVKNHGNCITEFRRFGETLKVERFILNITPNVIDEVFMVIFHEMTHVMQELRGDIKRLRDGSEVYHGIHYSVDILEKPTYKQYREFPWEVEARQVAYDMMKKWDESRGVKRSLWRKFTNFWRSL